MVVRTDFSDERVWDFICAEIQKPVGKFQASVNFLNEKEYDGVAATELIPCIPSGSSQTFIFVVDKKTVEVADHPILCIDLCDEPGRTFRVIPLAMWSVENSLSISNLNFNEFVDAADPDGVYRGLPQ